MVAELPDEDFAQPSGCKGWLVRDLVCHLVVDAQDVLNTLVTPAESLAGARAMLEEIAGAAFPGSLSDADALLIGTGRRAPTESERAALGDWGGRLPLFLG
ncbi:maleylpyruvate isomerase N-terminal domain-containing protein [Streptomyces sp. NPDC048254]|uniref:maleylpyruvate isomerase N-terminal domain-containing protein n=1 Tax=Streptomyces sp. NPDC048254 TaxID=3365525 RepID=UPI0037182EEE